MRSIVSFILFLVYPIWLPYHVVTNPKNSGSTKALSALFSLVVLLPIWVGGYFFISLAAMYGLQYMGVVKTEIPVTGTSMLPTFSEQGMVPVRHYPQFSAEIKNYIDVAKFQPAIHRGDVVVFRNRETTRIFAEQNEDPRARGGFVKRVVGVEGDTVRIENGFVYVNGQNISEPYILKARSTFGGDAIRDCQEVKVPKNKYFVLGDNRKVSVDSRQVGLVDTKDIYYFMPYKDQIGTYSSRWRDTSQDDKKGIASELNVDEYLRLLNEKREASGSAPLKYNKKLSESAKLRAEVMLRFDDTSFEATRSGYTMEEAMADVGYSNIVYGEFPIVGYYEAQELIDAIFEYPSSRNYMLEKDYQEIGVSTFVGKRNGCPVQIVVQHLAGYKPPNYAVKDIEEWKKLNDKLEEIKGGWAKLRNEDSAKDFYEENKTDIDRINDIINMRQSRARQIITRMEANEWFTAEEQKFIEEDKVLFEEQNAIAERLNRRIKGEE